MKLDQGKSNKLFFWLFALSMALALGVALMSGTSLRYEDERDYFALAQQMVQGHGYVTPALQPTAYRPPGYPFLMTLFAGTDQGVLWLKILNVVILGVSVWLMRALIARETPAVAWLAGASLLAYPVWLYAASTLYPQTLCMALMLGLIYLLAHREASWRTFIVAGVVYGYLVLVAPSFQLLAPLFAAYVAFFGPFAWRRNVLSAIVFGLMTVATMSPWLVRNYQVFGQFVPVATNGGVNLLLGNSEFTRVNSGVDVDLKRYLQQTQGLDEVQSSKALQGFATDWIKAHPMEAASLYVGKALNYFNYHAEAATSEQNAPWKDWLMFFTYYPMLAMVLARWVMVGRVPLSRSERLLIGVYVINGLLAALFFTRIRFRLPFDGLLMVLAIVSLGHFMQLRVNKTKKP